MMINILIILFSLLALRLIYVNLLDLFCYLFPQLRYDYDILLSNRTTYLINIYEFSYLKFLNGRNNTYKNILSMVLHEVNDNYMPKYKDDILPICDITFYTIEIGTDIKLIPLNKPILFQCIPYSEPIPEDYYFNNIEWLDNKDKYFNTNLILVKVNVFTPTSTYS